MKDVKFYGRSLNLTKPKIAIILYTQMNLKHNANRKKTNFADFIELFGWCTGDIEIFRN